MPKDKYIKKVGVKLSRDPKGRLMIKIVFPTKSVETITRYLAKT